MSMGAGIVLNPHDRFSSSPFLEDPSSFLQCDICTTITIIEDLIWRVAIEDGDRHASPWLEEVRHGAAEH